MYPYERLLDGSVQLRTCREDIRSSNEVEEGLIRHRISLLQFDEADVLHEAAQDLILNGFSASQFCLLGSTAVLSGLRPLPKVSEGPGRALAELWTEPLCRLNLANGEHVEMRCGTRAASLFDNIAPKVAVPEWSRPELSRSISHSISEGRMILLVSSASAKQHAQGARLLLRHGKHDLQTHEFSIRHPQ